MKYSPVLTFTFAMSLISSPQAGSYMHSGLFWQFSDVHVDLDYANHRCKGRLGNLNCDSPLSLWVSALNATRELTSSRPDFIIFSGDSVAHTTSRKEVFERTMETVASALKLIFPPNQKDSIPVILSLGNHDVFPDNIMAVTDGDSTRQLWCTRLGSSPELWGDWIANDSEAESDRFNDGCYYSRVVKVGRQISLRIVSLNGLIYARRNSLSNPSLADPLGQFGWLVNQLLKARQENEKVLLVMHFPLGAPENSPIDFRHLHDVYNGRFLEIFLDFSDVIALGLFGHQHTDTYRVLDVQSQGIFSNGSNLPLFFIPSVSPFYFRNIGGFLPRIRLFNYSVRTLDTSRSHPQSLEILDFYQYYANLSSTGWSPWDLEYVATKAYNLNNLSGSNLKGLLDRFESVQELWCSYWNHELGIGMPHESGPCPEIKSRQHCRHMCSLRYLHFPSLDKCLSKCEEIGNSLIDSLRTTANQKLEENWNAVPIIVLVIIAFLAILIGVVLLANRELCRRKAGLRRSRRRLEFNGERYRRQGTYLIAYHQPGLNAVEMRLSPLDENGLGLGNGFENEELKALNVGEVEDSAYDATSSGDEEIPKISTGTEDLYSVCSSPPRQGIVQSQSLPLYSP